MAEVLFENTAPLCFLPDGRLVCYQHGDILVLTSEQELLRFSLFKSLKERFLGRNRLISRFMRLGIRVAVALNDSMVILSIGNMLYELDINTGYLSEGYNCGEGIRPLVFTTVENIKGIDDGIYFGGYVHNFDKKPVNIYHRTKADNWEVVYTFPQGAINHVHNIVADPYRQCLWIYTGDFDESSAIWKVTDSFNSVERVVCNDQKYRGCVAYALPEGLLYATDAPYAKNFIYLFKPDILEVKEVFPIDGSCIYGCQWKDKYLFSSTVEGDGRDETLIKLAFSRKRGSGIKDDAVHLYMGNYTNGFEEVYKEEKDWLPFLFQFGVFKFPAGINNSDTLFFQPVATNVNDMCLMCMTDNHV